MDKPDTALVGAVCPSPNFEPRRGGARPSILLLHYTGVASAAKAIDWLSRAESKVSAHYVVDEAGQITQLVAEEMRAWHAGLAVWAGESDINSASIGIEIHNPGHESAIRIFPSPSSAPSRRCAGTSSPGTASGPSACSPTPTSRPPARRIRARSFHGHAWRAPASATGWRPSRGIGPTRDCPRRSRPAGGGGADPAGGYGYGIEATGGFDPKTEFVVTAFQRHFRPERVDGRIDQSTVTTLERLIAALPKGALAS